jgi:hypothetical protein
VEDELTIVAGKTTQQLRALYVGPARAWSSHEARNVIRDHLTNLKALSTRTRDPSDLRERVDLVIDATYPEYQSDDDII